MEEEDYIVKGESEAPKKKKKNTLKIIGLVICILVLAYASLCVAVDIYATKGTVKDAELLERIEKEESEQSTTKATKSTTETTTASDVTVLKKKTYDISGNELTISFSVDNNTKATTLMSSIKANDRDTANIMFLEALYVSQKLADSYDEYGIMVEYNDLFYMLNCKDGKNYTVGSNSDGSTTLKKPDWITDDSDEMQSLIKANESIVQDVINAYTSLTK